ncbi:MAG: Hsp70 family protein [Chloroflexi bacterium]|nr:Hsp70 family protein [Chloroflexota bacterium]
MSKIIGIDLGTTNSGVAIVQNGQPVMLPSGIERIIPSVVSYASDGKWLVGTPARNQYLLDPDNTVVSIKRQMGTETKVTMGGKTFTPPEVSAFILRKLQQIAAQHLGEAVTDAVITVPAYFSDGQRQATRDAGRIAGLNVRRIINEPTAAALVYGLNLEEDKLVLVYDLGGGTFDVSLVELMGGIVEVRATHGNTQLGGDDFDLRLAEYVADWFEEEYDVDLRFNRRAWARLLRAAEDAKIELSSKPYTWLKEAYIAEKDGVPLHLEFEVSRADFEDEIADLLAGTLDSIKRVLADGEATVDELDQVLLVGGSTRIPAVWELVAETTGLNPQTTINPDEAVALGAAVQAAIIDGEPIDAILVDVTPHSLGIAVAEQSFSGELIPDRYKALIHRNTTIPVTKEEKFHTVHPNQDTIQIEVYQGEKPIATQNTLLGQFKITGLKPAVPGMLAEVTVQFDLDLDGILHVIARDRYTDSEADITLQATVAQMDGAAVDEAREKLAETAVTPLPANLQALVIRAEKLLANQEIEDVVRANITALLADIRAAQISGYPNRLSELEDTLLDMLFDHEE